MATNVYGNGTNSTAGANTITHYYDKAGIKSATEVNVYGQWADRKSMPLKMGKTFKISKFLNIYDRLQTDPEFESKGYLTSRSITDVSTGMPTLAEGAQDVNKRSISKITFETSFARYGEMIDYTDEVEMWSEDAIQVRYREQLGELANRRMEDLIQLDMLGTTNVMYAGLATSNVTLGDSVAADGTDDDLYRIDYDVVRKAARKLTRNRAEKNTSIVTGSTKIDTRTVNKAYYAITGPEIKYDLESITRGSDSATEYVLIQAFKYAAAGKMAEGEYGQIADVKFIETSSGVVYAAEGAKVPQNYVGGLSSSGGTDNTSADENDRDNFDVFPVLFPTKGAFATVGLKGHGKVKFNSSAPSAITNTNAYGTLGMFSYNFFYAGIILKEECLLKVQTLASI